MPVNRKRQRNRLQPGHGTDKPSPTALTACVPSRATQTMTLARIPG